MASPHFSTTQMDNRGTRQSFLVTYSNSDLSLFPTRESFGVAVAEAFDFGPAESKVSIGPVPGSPTSIPVVSTTTCLY